MCCFYLNSSVSRKNGEGMDKKISGNLCSNCPVPLAQSQVWDVSFCIWIFTHPFNSLARILYPLILSLNTLSIYTFIHQLIHSFPNTFSPWVLGTRSELRNMETVTHTLHSRWFTNEWGKQPRKWSILTPCHRCYEIVQRLPCRHHLGLHSRFPKGDDTPSEA